MPVSFSTIRRGVGAAALLIVACTPGGDTDGLRLRETVDTDAADTSDTAGPCETPARLRLENRSTAVLSWVDVCAGADCVGYIDGIGTEPGDDWEVEACPGETRAVAGDREDACASSDWFELRADEVTVWTVTVLDGEWVEESGGGTCGGGR